MSAKLSDFDAGIVVAASIAFQQGENTLAFEILNRGDRISVATVNELNKPMVRKWLSEKKRKARTA